MRWTMIGRRVSPTSATLVYGAEGTDIRIESRRRQIPHANGVGSWEYTDYAVVLYGADLTVKHRLIDAKEAAEDLIREQEHED